MRGATACDNCGKVGGPLAELCALCGIGHFRFRTAYEDGIIECPCCGHCIFDLTDYYNEQNSGAVLCEECGAEFSYIFEYTVNIKTEVTKAPA